jgi:tellurite resistance protein TehA-like permease
VADLPAQELDDHRDRDELRDRYYGLLQELRVVLPGVQVLMAFLLTAPFSSRFDDLDDLGVSLYLVALVSSTAATICCIAPTVYHRAGARTSRSSRLSWAIRLTRMGFVLLAIALMSSVVCVSRFVRGADAAAWIAGVLGVLLLVSWVALPLLTASHSGASAERRCS